MTATDSTLTCPLCGVTVAPQETLCPRCGAKLPKRPCPFCGEEVAPGTAACPFCHLEIIKDAPKVGTRPGDDTVDGAIDDLLDQLKKFHANSVAKTGRLVCLKCNLPLDGTESSCPNCRADLRVARAFACPKCHEPLNAEDGICPSCRLALKPSSVSAAEVQRLRTRTRQLRKPSEPTARIGTSSDADRTCPACGMPVGATAGTCPYCGTTVPAAVKRSPLFIAPAQQPAEVDASTGLKNKAKHIIHDDSSHIVTPGPVKSQSSQRGYSNGVGQTNGDSFVNGRKTGATNGASFVNGKKKTPGSSFVNGTGVSNGLKRAGGKKQSGGLRGLVGNWKFVAVLVAIIVVIPTFIFIAGSHGGAPYQIDGNFTDWRNAIMHGARAISSSASTSLEQWSVETYDDSVYVYARMGGNLMSGSNVESVFVYIDSDAENSTGYAVGGLGADYLIELDGWNGTLGSETLLRFEPGNRYNWNGWQSAGQVEAALSGNKIETRAQLPQALDSEARFLLVTQDVDQSQSLSYEVPSHGGVLIVRQIVPENVTSSGVVQASTNAHLMDLEVSCEGASGTVQGLSPTMTGGTPISQIQGFDVKVGEKQTFEIRADLTNAATGDLISASLSPRGVTTNFEAVQIIGVGCAAYVNAAPAKIVIDGAFADWQGKTTSRVSNSSGTDNVRINSAGAVNESESAFFYVSVDGQMCSGTYVPAIRGKASGSGQGIVIRHNRTAQDEMRVYIDSDRSVSTGAQVAADQRILGADHLISIKGIYGKVVEILQYDWIAGQWDETPAAQVKAATDYHRMEISASSSSIGTASTVDFTIQTTSWRGIEDSVASQSRPDPWVMRSGGADYRSSDGVNWAPGSTISLTGGDAVADMAPTSALSKDYVYAVTNSGRIYSWQVGVSTSWSSNVTDPVNGTANVVAVAPYDRGTATGAYVLGSDGRLWNTLKLDGTLKAWSWVKKVADGVTDFTDIEYQKTGQNFYALRAGSNTPVYWAGTTMNWATTSSTGSSSTQTHVLHVGAARQQNERILVLCSNGAIRNSADGGATWSALGNLPAPGGGNQSIYTGMDFDTSGYLWVITDTGWCYKSSDTTTFASFACTGRATDLGGIVALTAPVAIPELGSFAVPAILLIGVLMVARATRRRR